MRIPANFLLYRIKITSEACWKIVSLNFSDKKKKFAFQYDVSLINEAQFHAIPVQWNLSFMWLTKKLNSCFLCLVHMEYKIMEMLSILDVCRISYEILGESLNFRGVGVDPV